MRAFNRSVIILAVTTAMSVPLMARPQEGAHLYTTFCAACHGAQGMGDGPMSSDLRVKPADLTMLAQKNGGLFPSDLVYRTIDGKQRVRGHGGPDMPVWGDVFSRTAGWDPEAVKHRIDMLVKHVESLQARQGSPVNR